MADTARARRLAKRIAQIVASGLEYEVKDPRLAMVTITDARVTPDLRDATVYYTVFGDDADHASTAAALASATGVLRSRVGQQTGVRFTPTLTFVADTVPDDARRLDELLAQAREADAEVARLASTAEHAGDADPYRVDTEDDDDDTDGADAEARSDADVRRGPQSG
ncbi:ribosome-binding factor A [Saccharopolyspora erythraea NRRL 2338]|uniref:Ribosome-binding factor A n=2 Tax=Saccharopolyspora erythraea TaxID=1836 RepID=RBFA_SACEN|nr:30S ribosome-binding factor RbfA [Saccharopolyspora erythraea]A4FM32.1 RecName: Full=Ribosome-binding factor A [Saccharopolyspora erythraea NRRL 2338]EQD88242.1 ribosome-binding factor A [Saccharopolyspora erythraea D]PFG98746.1 ribosome-binding factor A [Saccharopolyspora erythraea NRRL 2338]QRK88753.1 30S ribosome-binding factor RbfA [Saccharopolyspora erythraea]CAM05107.1 ribosome-binding factor A [Saccharopolyspora erythraea NRRL 2338]